MVSHPAASLNLPLEVRDVFLSYSVLRLDKCDVSHDLLLRASKVAAPIARKRGWSVKKLREFQPKNRSLYGLNVNRGQEVCIRTRTEHGFLEFESVLKTLLHELVHNVHGNHSAAFYEMLDELEKEAETVMFRAQHGITEPARYWGAGRQLGRGPLQQQQPLYPHVRTVDRGKGYRLGGASAGNITAREAAVRAALARRRIDDEHSCGTQQSQEDAEDDEGNVIQVAPLLPTLASGSAKPVQQPSLIPVSSSSSASSGRGSSSPEVIIIDHDDEEVAGSRVPHQGNKPLPVPERSSEPEGEQGHNQQQSSAPFGVPIVVVIDEDDDNGTESKDGWRCPKCTFANEESSLLCIECLAVRPGRWQCPRCSFVNIQQHLQCLACHTVQPTSF